MSNRKTSPRPSPTFATGRIAGGAIRVLPPSFVQNGWSRSVLLNWLSTGLYESEGKAQTNIPLTLPAADSDLARQLVRDPQVFKEHNRVLVRIHLEKFGLPMGVTDYQIKRLLPTVEQLAKCYVDTEAQLADTH